MSYPPFQYKMTPIRYSRPGSGFDPREQANDPRLQAASLPGREHPVDTCAKKCGHGTLQKYFWDDPYDLPIYDPSPGQADYRDAMILGQFNPKNRRHPWTLYRRKPDPDADGSVRDLQELEGFNNAAAATASRHQLVIVLILVVLVVVGWMWSQRKN
jgi:hypothetical protein